MKKLILITSFFTVGIAHHINAQFTQVEFFSGYQKADFTFFSSQYINDNPSLSLNSLAFFQIFTFKESQQFNEIGAQPTLFWNINKNIAVGPSLYYNSVAGYSKRLSAKFTLKNTRFLFVVTSTVAYSLKSKSPYAEGFAQFQFNLPITQKISFWFNGQFLTVWDGFKTHSRSFEQLRTGISITGHQIGIGLDLDQYGPESLKKIVFGFYYRNSF